MSVLTTTILAASIATGDPIAFSPATVDFGTHAPETAATATAWIINTTDEPIVVEAAKPKCGCTTLTDFEPGVIEPNGFMALTLEVEAPKESGKAKKAAVEFTFSTGMQSLPLQIAACDEATESATCEVADAPTGGFQVVPASFVFDEIPVEERRSQDLWLINDSDEPVMVDEIALSCGCLTTELDADVVMPGEAVRLALTARGKKKPSTRSQDVRLILDDDQHVVVAGTITTVESVAQADVEIAEASGL